MIHAAGAPAHVLSVAAAVCLTYAMPCHASAATQQLALRIDTGDTSCEPWALQHTAALVAAREDRLSEGLQILGTLRERCPVTAPFLFDHVAVSTWAGQHESAWRDGQTLAMRADTPAYVVESLAVAARETGRFDTALAIYGALLAREPGRVDAQIGRAVTLLRQGRTDAARVALREILARMPQRDDVLALLVQGDIDAGNWAGVLATAQAALERAPQSTAALRLRFRALRELGAIQLAIHLTPPEILTAGERTDAERLRIASQTRFARIDADQAKGPQRWAATDAAIEHAAKTADARLAENRAAEARAAQYDLLAALVDRRRMAEAIALYEKLAAAETPAFVRLAAATAYLAERRPREARRLYESALISDPRNLTARFGYYYALLENGDDREALAFMQKLAAETPEWRDAAIPELRRANPDYPLVQARLGLALAYTNQLSLAQRHLDDLTLRAPANLDVRNSRNIVYQLRGWPRRAEDDYHWMLAANPDYPWAASALFDSAMAVRDYPAAERWLTRAAEELPDEDSTRRREIVWAIHNSRELRVNAGMGRGYGGSPVSEPGTARDQVLDVVAYSRPIDQNWRVFGRANDTRQRSGGESRERTAGGGGVEYRQRDWLGSAELLALGDGHDPALSTRVLHDLGDRFSISAEAETNTLALPVRAYEQGTDARRAAFDVSYRRNESTSAGLGLSHMRFSDGNRRTAWFGNARQTVLASSAYQLDARLDAYASRNSPEVAAPYFNPREDRSLLLTLQNEWQQFRDYERVLRHRLSGTAGTYWQAGAGGDALYGVRYEISYEPDQRLALNGGVGVTWRPFDGVRERLTNFFFSSNWRF